MDRREKYEAKSKALGLTKVCVWAPADQADKVKALAEKLRRAMLRAMAKPKGR